MSWLARSLAKSLLSGDSDASDVDNSDPSSPPLHAAAAGDPSFDPPRGVKEDLSELTETLTRRFHGLTSFLAPSPSHPDPQALGSDAGIHGDLVEISEKLRAGLSRISGHKAVSEFAKIASSLLPPARPEEEVVGVSEEVVAFVKDASMHAEMWLDFPLLPEEEESDDFDMSDAQQDHALAVESLAPELADLRIELCPSHMSESCFWKVYFVLLHTRLNKEDAQLLSTPQIVEARETLLHKLQNQIKLQRYADTVAVSFSKLDDTVPSPVELVAISKDLDEAARTMSFSNVDYGMPQQINLEAASKDTVDAAGAVSSDNIDCSILVQLVPVSKDTKEVSLSKAEETTSAISAADSEMEKQPGQKTEITLVDKSIIEKPLKQSPMDLSEASRIFIQKTDDDGDEWLEEEMGVPGSTSIPIGGDEDVSFSDLEEEDDTK